MNRMLATCAMLALVIGCATGEKKDNGFFTSGSREADQRAEQRVARDQQIKGESADGSKKSGPAAAPGAANVKKSLYERLGGDAGINAIVDDFVTRALADPRVNWERKGIKSGGLWHRGKSMEWNANEQNIANMKKHIAQFLALATGGPAVYEGKEMKQAHEGMRISNPEFDAALGDLKATLDKLSVATPEQKELLAVVESVRPMIVEQK